MRHLHKSLTFRRNETLRGQTMEERERFGAFKLAVCHFSLDPRHTHNIIFKAIFKNMSLHSLYMYV